MLEKNNIYLGDCLEVMKQIPNKSIDMILCDLPYGVTCNNWDSVIPLDSLWEQYNRVIKENGAIVLTAQTPFDKVLGASNIKMLKYEWVWVKNVATGHLNVRRMPLREHENILVFYRNTSCYKPIMVNGKPYTNKRKHRNDSGANYSKITRVDTVNNGVRFPKSVLRFDREIGLHPTQKPVSLFEYLIRTYTNEGETVLDNCIGSGTTAVAAINTGRFFIGIEKDEHYFKVAKDRIHRHTADLMGG